MTNRALRAAPEPHEEADDFSDLYEQIDAPANPAGGGGPWDPLAGGPGSEIKGRVIAAKEIDTKWGKKPVLTLATETGEREVRAFHTVLRNRLEEKPPAKGTRILIRYEGPGTTAQGHGYNKYAVGVEHTLNVTNGQSWIDVFNGTITAEQSSPQPVRRPASNTKPADASDLPF